MNLFSDPIVSQTASFFGSLGVTSPELAIALCQEGLWLRGAAAIFEAWGDNPVASADLNLAYNLLLTAWNAVGEEWNAKHGVNHRVNIVGGWSLRDQAAVIDGGEDLEAFLVSDYFISHPDLLWTRYPAGLSSEALKEVMLKLVKRVPGSAKADFLLNGRLADHIFAPIVRGTWAFCEFAELVEEIFLPVDVCWKNVMMEYIDVFFTVYQQTSTMVDGIDIVLSESRIPDDDDSEIAREIADAQRHLEALIAELDRRKHSPRG